MKIHSGFELVQRYRHTRKEGNVLFNDPLNTFYLVIWCQTYGKGPLSETGNQLLPLQGYSYLLTVSNFYMLHPTDWIAHTMAFVIPVVEHWVE